MCYNDSDGVTCFNQYQFIKFDNVHKIILKDLRDGIISNIKAHIHDKKVIDKLKYFVEYHNQQVKLGGDGFKEYLIDNKIFI